MDAGGALAVELPRVPEAPGMARRRLARPFGDALDEDRLRTAVLLTSELVTNALLHGEGSITLRATFDEVRLLVEVIDEGHGLHPALLVEVIDEGHGLCPAHRRRDRDRVGGYSLRIVDSEASRWGTRGATTHVWFELKRWMIDSAARRGRIGYPLAG